MAEAGEDYSSEDESDVPLLDSDTDEASDADEFDGELQIGEEGERLDEEDEIVIGSDTETETPNMEDTEPEQQTKEKTEAGDQTEKKPGKRVLNIPKFMFFVNEIFYREDVRPRHVNILTDFADAEIFMIDGDSLLLELLVEQSLDWSNGGQFLHLTYLLERFLQYFTDKGGVFHLVFFQDMEIIWASRPSMLLARQAIILHLQHNTSFTVITSINNFWGKEWKEYIDDKIPAFLLLTDAENIPWENSRRKTRELQFFFRSLLLHSLGFGLNCVFIAGVEMTATKVMGYYIESTHKMYYRQVQKPSSETWDFLINCFRKEASEVGLDYSLDFPSSQIDVKEKVKNAFQSPPQGGCRELATLLACEMILCTVLNKLTNESPDFKEKTMESTSDRIKLFLLHSVLLKKLPLKYRAHTINANLLDQFCKQEDGEVYPFREIHKCLLEVLKVIQDEYPSMKAGGHSLDMTSVADLMDGRLVHTLFSLALDQRSMDLEAFSLPEDVIEELESLWSKVVAAVNTTEHSVVLRSHFLPIFAGSMTSFPRKEGESSTPETCVRLRQLLDVEHVLVNEYAGDIRSKINAMAEFESGEENMLNNGREFDERYHWHSMKPLSDDYDKAKKLITGNDNRTFSMFTEFS